MHTPTHTTFTTIRIEGAILPPDLLQRVADGDSNIAGLSPDAYHLAKGEKPNEAINRAWNRVLGAWAAFRARADKLSEGDAGTTITREHWLLPLFTELGYGRLATAKAIEIAGDAFPISHGWQNTPIHLVGLRVDLDTRTKGVAGAARNSPHSLVQILLNRSDAHLWAFVSNGLRLRILRDNKRLTRQAYVEFDLQAMMEGQVYSDFCLLWLLSHQSRVEAERPEECWLEKWSRAAQEQGTRALDQLRGGVEEAISALGRGFLAHPANRDLRDKLYKGKLEAQDYYRQLLRLVYRLIFLFVAEDRGLLFNPYADATARDIYSRFYSTAKLRALAERRRGTRHADLYHAVRLVMEKLGGDLGYIEIGLPALGGFLFSPQAIPDLGACEIANHDLLDAIRALAFTMDRSARRVVDYKNLGSEELGSVYESLLELHPIINSDAHSFELKTASGNERKTTGSFYTPTPLINVLLDSALDPILDEACRKSNPEQAILLLKVCDSAGGSGHIAIAAARRIAKRLATIRTGDEEPSPDAMRTALRDVIMHCIYVVDVNPMAIELCKVNLWMEMQDPRYPLSFLDAHIKCGNSLIGVAPGMDITESPRGGEIPDEAFNPVTGDHKPTASALKKRNKAERAGQLSFDLTATAAADDFLHRVTERARKLNAMPEETATQVQAKGEAYRQFLASEEYARKKSEYDLWTAAFFWQIKEDARGVAIVAPTQGELARLRRGERLNPELVRGVQALAERLRFFHWELEFPEVFEQGGFDVILGNPPYDVIREDRFLAFQPAGGTGNFFAHFVMSSIPKTAPNGSLAFVLPLSIACGGSFEKVRRALYKNFGELWTSHYGIRPAKLFRDAEQRITLLRALKRGHQSCRVYSTRLHRWHPGEEHKVLAGAEYGLVGTLQEGLVPKVAGKIGASVYKKILQQPHDFKQWLADDVQSGIAVFYHSVARYWIKAYDFLPYFQREGEEPDVSTKLKTVVFYDKTSALRFLLLINSSLFYYWWMTQSDEFDVTESEVLGFPIPAESAAWPSELVVETSVQDLMQSYKTNSVRRRHRFGGRLVTYDEFRPRRSLEEIYAIDNMIAQLYELNADESEFVKNYDLEFRTDEE